MATDQNMPSVRSKFLFGGVGGIAPVLMNLVVIDLETLLIDLTVLALISYLIRVMALFAIGGLVAVLNRTENDPLKIFQLGIAAPALITAFINGSNVTVPKKLADQHAAVSAVTSYATHINLISSSYAQPPSQEEIKQFSLPEETAAQQFYRGFFGAIPKNVWFVIVGSHLKREDAERQAEQVRAKGFSAGVYEPYGGNPYYPVVIGAQLTLSEAQQLRLKAINTGLPKDTYLWTFPSIR
jgi:hypothetical protein